jgi:Flp pilus assembly CpaE family ATPase
MLITCWSVKGGTGVSVVSAALAGLMAERHGSATLLDLGGDQPAILGLPEPAGPGALDWCDSDADPAALGRLALEVASDLSLVPRGRGPASVGPQRGCELIEAAGALSPVVVVDAGEPIETDHDTVVTEPDLPGHDRHRHPAVHLREAGTSLLVTTSCYVALRRATRSRVSADGVVLLAEPGRALDRRDVEHVLGLPVVGVVEADPAVRRAVDSGRLMRRVPASLARGLRRAG